MKRIKSLFVFAVAAALCGCHSGNKSTNEEHLLAVEDSDEYMLPRGVDPSHEVPCPEFETIEEAEIVFAQSGLNYCFCQFIADNPSTMEYRFNILQESENMPLTIADAPDGAIRVYGWDNHMGGTCISWSAMYQVRDKGKVYTFEGLPDWEYDAHLVTAIYKLPHPKRNLYLFDTYLREWSSQSYNGFVAYERIGHELKRVPILRGEEGDLVNEIGFEYCVPEFYFNFARALTWDYLYHWDADKDILYFPVPREDKYTYMTDRFVRYRWNKKTLEPTDTVANPRIYEPLRDYITCLQHTKAGCVQVRVDSLADGRLRYTAWDREQDISTKPNLVLYGKRVGDEYHFYNPPTYTYVVTIEDVPEVRTYHSDIPGQLGELYDTYTDN
jgi:hypothetical protein